MPMTPLPPSPSRADPSNFAARGDALLGAFPTFVTQANALEVNVDAKEIAVNTNAISAAANAALAAANAALAAANATATLWVSGTTYAIADIRRSPVNAAPYRRLTTGAGATDPSADTVNWALFVVAQATNAATANAGPGNSAFSMRNRIINGDMRIDQRNNGAAVTVGATNTYITDRFFTQNNTGTGTYTAQQSTLGNSRSLKITATAALTDLTTSKRGHGVYQQVEAQNSFDLNSKTVTWSFKVETNWAGNLAVSIRNSAFTRAYVVDVVVSSGTNAVSGTLTLEATTTSGNTNGAGVSITIGFNNEGTIRTATTGAWVAGAFACSTSSTQWAKTTGNFINVTDVQLEEGTVATPFERRPIGLELALCQRYFQQAWFGVLGFAANVNTTLFYPTFVVPMRAIPTVSSPVALVITDGIADFTQTTSGILGIDASDTRPRVIVTNFTGLVANRAYAGTGAPAVSFSAEL